MELASYLHRRVEEISKQFSHRSFRINGNEKKESPLWFLHGQPCGSDLPCRASIADSQRACDPADQGNLQEKLENRVAEEERASSLAGEKIGTDGVSFGSCFTNTFLPDFSGCTDMNGRTTKLYYYGSDAGADDDVLLLLREKLVSSVEDAQVLPSTQRGEKITSSSQNPTFESTAPLCRPRAPLPGPVSCANSPENVSDTGLPRDALPIQENQDQHICLDAADAPTSKPREEKNPTSSTPQSPLLCLTPCGNSSENVLPLLQHSISGVHSTENVSHADLPLRIPSLQEHVFSDAEDARVLWPMQKGENLSRQPPPPGISRSCVESSENVCDGGLLRKGVVISLLHEHVEQQICLDSQDAQVPSSLAVAENSSPQSGLPRSMSSVDSSEWDNCRLENVTVYLVEDKAKSKNSTRTSRHKSEEIDAMSEAGCLDTHKKDNDDDEGTLVVAGVDTACAGSEEMRNGALDLLLNAIQVTSGGGFAEKDDDDAHMPSSYMKKHVRGVRGDGTSEERKEVLEPSLLHVFRRTRKAGTNGQCGLSERFHGDIRPCPNSSEDTRDNTRKRKSTELSSKVLLPVGRFPIVRKRSARRPKTALKEEPSGNSVPIVMRFKSLQAVSEVDFSSRKSMKRPSDNKQEERRKRPLLEMQERGQILYVSPADLSRRDSKRCLGPKQQKRERPSDKKQEGQEREDSSSKQEKGARPLDDLQESQEREQTSEAMEAKDEEEPVVLSKRGRSQVLPNKFSDSVLQPWKKKDRRKE